MLAAWLIQLAMFSLVWAFTSFVTSYVSVLVLAGLVVVSISVLERRVKGVEVVS